MSSFTFNKTWNNDKWNIINFLHNKKKQWKSVDFRYFWHKLGIMTEYWHYCGFLVHFHPSFFFFVFIHFFVLDEYYVIYWKTNTITVQKVTFCFFDSSHEKIKQRLRWPCQNVEISSSSMTKMWVFQGDSSRMIITMRKGKGW